MSLPCVLGSGVVSIYNASKHSIYGIEAKGNFNFGTISQTWNNGASPPYVGSSVMYDGTDIMGTIQFSGVPYFLLEEGKIVLIEKAP